MGMMIHRRKLRERNKANDIKEAPKVEKMIEQPKSSVDQKPEKTVEQHKISVEEIKKLPYFSLKSLAARYGVDVKDKKTDEIRDELISKVEG